MNFIFIFHFGNKISIEIKPQWRRNMNKLFVNVAKSLILNKIDNLRINILALSSATMASQFEWNILNIPYSPLEICVFLFQGALSVVTSSVKKNYYK